MRYGLQTRCEVRWAGPRWASHTTSQTVRTRVMKKKIYTSCQSNWRHLISSSSSSSFSASATASAIHISREWQQEQEQQHCRELFLNQLQLISIEFNDCYSHFHGFFFSLSRELMRCIRLKCDMMGCDAVNNLRKKVFLADHWRNCT